MKRQVVNVDDVVVGKRFRKDIGDLTPLITSIAEVGLLQPIVLTPEMKLIAGRRRLAAWKKGNFGDTIPACVVDGLDEALLLIKAERDENVCRKDFTPSEAVELGRRLEELERPKAEKRKEDGGKSGRAARYGRLAGGKLPPANSGKTRDRVGESVGMSGTTYEKAKAVVDSGDDDAIAVMESSGKVNAAYKVMKRNQKDAEDAKAAAKAKREIKSDDANGIYHGDSFKLAHRIPDKSCALIFTDPPYDRQSLPLFGQLAELAARILVDGGSLITYCGQYVIPEVLGYCSELKFFWINCCLHTGDTAQMREYGIKVKWKPMLWFVKGSFRRDRATWVDDLVQSQQEKDAHPWQQSVVEASYYIERLTSKGELVVDPFCGAGTTALAAKTLNRQWWTADIDAKHVAAARRRIK